MIPTFILSTVTYRGLELGDSMSQVNRDEGQVVHVREIIMGVVCWIGDIDNPVIILSNDDWRNDDRANAAVENLSGQLMDKQVVVIPLGVCQTRWQRQIQLLDVFGCNLFAVFNIHVFC